MKKIAFLFYTCLLFNTLLAQNHQATATQYARILYVAKVSNKSGDIKNMAAHLVLKGTGQLNWKQEITQAGDYEVILDYSVRQNGSSVTVRSEKNSITNLLDITEGVFPEGKEWFKFNCARKLLAGRLILSKGMNSINLEINPVDKDFETIIYALELIPVKKQKSVRKEVAKARKSRPNLKSFRDMKYGTMFHWTSLTTPRSGPLMKFDDAVKKFDAGAFANMVEKTGSDYVIFTGCWAETYIPAPLKKWEEEYPGHTTSRDLIAAIADSLKKRNIKFFLYLSTHVYAKYNKVDTKEFSRLNAELVAEIGNRYKEKITGYWFDGWYQSYQMHPDFNFENFYKICKAGNKKRLVALNSWLYPITSEWQDYWAGEIYSPGTIPSGPIIEHGPGKGLQFQGLLALQGDWAHTPLNQEVHPVRLKADTLINYIRACSGRGPVTINIEIYQDGTIGDEALAEMEKLKHALKKNDQQSFIHN